jgi:hypothetical protein
MSNSLFGLGRNNFGTKQINWTSDVFKATLLSMSVAAGKIALISSSTNATPIAITTSGAHGISVGDIVVVGGHATNTAANGTWQAGSGTAGTTLNLTTKLDGVNSTGNGVGGATGWVINLSQASTLADVSGNSIGTSDPSLSGESMALGVANCSAIAWTNANGLTATKAWAVAIYDTTAANDLICFIDGTFQVYVITQASATATSIAVARLSVQIPNGATLVFSDGSSATLTAQANVGDTSLTVSALAAIVHRQATADTPTLGCGLPVTPAAGGNLTLTPDSGANKLFAL